MCIPSTHAEDGVCFCVERLGQVNSSSSLNNAHAVKFDSKDSFGSTVRLTIHWLHCRLLIHYKELAHMSLLFVNGVTQIVLHNTQTHIN